LRQRSLQKGKSSSVNCTSIPQLGHLWSFADFFFGGMANKTVNKYVIASGECKLPGERCECEMARNCGETCYFFDAKCVENGCFSPIAITSR
jgi:hypothetical protein